MKYTNNKNLSSLMAGMIEKSMRRYDPGDSDYSTTTLIDAPRVVNLKRKHENEIELDVSDLVDAFIGNAIHAYLEELAPEGSLVEKRLFAEIDGLKISGCIDVITLECEVGDYKKIKVWALSKEDTYEKWEQQLNINAWLLKNGKVKSDDPVQDSIDQSRINNLLHTIGLNEKAFIEYFPVDWQGAQAEVKKSYPQQQQARWECKLWSEEKQLEFIKERIRLHEAAKKELPLCSDKERWKKDDTHKLMKKGRKTSLKNESTLEALIEWATKKGHYRNGKLINQHYFEFFPGEYTRCKKYCPVDKFCEQWRGECNNE